MLEERYETQGWLSRRSGETYRRIWPRIPFNEVSWVLLDDRLLLLVSIPLFICGAPGGGYHCDYELSDFCNPASEERKNAVASTSVVVW